MSNASVEARGALVTDIPNYPIKPEDLLPSRYYSNPGDYLAGILPSAALLPAFHYWGAFGHFQSELSAKWVVRLSQELGGWTPFTEAQMEDFYNRGRYQNFNFNRLVHPQKVIDTLEGNWRMAGGGWIVEIDGKYHVTTAFVEQIQKSLETT